MSLANGEFEHPSVGTPFWGIGRWTKGWRFTTSLICPRGLVWELSSAFTVGLLLASALAPDQMRNKHTLATDALQVEQEVIRKSRGARRIGPRRIRRLHKRTLISALSGGFEVKPVSMTSAGPLGGAAATLRAVFAGFSGTASEIAQEQIRTTPQRKRELDLMYQMVGEAEAIVTNPNRSLNEFGCLLHESWQLKRSLTQKITNTNLDEIAEAGPERLRAWRQAARSGEGGGFMLFLRAARTSQRIAGCG